MRLDDDRLIHLALGALEDVAARCHHGPVKRSRALGAVLAYLASRSRGERWPFDRFWQCVEDTNQKHRWSGAHAALNGIYLAGGWTRSVERISFFETAARREAGLGASPELR